MEIKKAIEIVASLNYSRGLHIHEIEAINAVAKAAAYQVEATPKAEKLWSIDGTFYYCPTCGKWLINPDWAFCPDCGQKVKK